MGRLDTKVAFITGGARGLGASIATHFFNEGAEIIIGDVNIDEATKRAKKLCAAKVEARLCWLDIGF